jgi:hypothetical protein
MTSNALRVVPVVDGIGESTCICVNRERIFLGRANGTIGMYKISTMSNQALSIPTVELGGTLDTGSKKPIGFLTAAGRSIVAISGESAFVSLVSGDSVSSPTVLAKNICAAAIEESSSNMESYPRIILSTLRKRLMVFTFNSKTNAYAQEGPEISTPAGDQVTRLAWFNQWIIGASARSYVCMHSEERDIRDVFPVDAFASICILKASNEVLLVGHDGLGIFMNIQSDGLAPAPRNTISVNHSDASLSVIGTYLASVSAADGVVDVFSLTSNDTRLIQTINLPSSGLAACGSSSTSVGLPVVAGSVLYLLITVPFESQLKKLIENQKLEEALDLVNYQYPPGDERDAALKKFHKQVAWKLFSQNEFSVAFVHFSLAADHDDVEKLLAQWPSVSNVSANAPMAAFLRGYRQLCVANAELLRRIDLLLIELLSEFPEELVEFIKSGTCSLGGEDGKKALSTTSPVGLAYILEQQGDPSEAIRILVSKSPVPANELMDVLARNIEALEPKTVASAVAELVEATSNIEKLVKLVSRAVNPLEIIDGLGNSSHFHPFVRQVLENVSDANTEALSRLLKLAVHDGDTQLLEILVKRNKLTSVDGLQEDSEFAFTQMLLLGNQKRYREAFVKYPQFGERLIDSVSSDMPRSQMLLLLCAVLFENNASDQAVDILLRNEQGMLADLRPSQIVEILPVDLALTTPIIQWLKRLNRKCHNSSRESTISEHKQSYRFLSAYNEWSELRQTKPAIVNTESVCSICSTQLGEKQRSVAILPNGNIAHPACLDPTTVRVSQRMV